MRRRHCPPAHDCWQLTVCCVQSEGIEGLASTEKKRRRLEQLRQAAEEQQQRECTFRPDTSKPRVIGYYDEYQPPAPAAPLSIAQAARQGFESLMPRIADYQADREARAAAARQAREAQQLAECTFSPSINRGQAGGKGPTAAQPVVVPGLERFLELKQLADEQKRAQEERAARVFNQNPAGGALAQGRRATVPKPFKLAGQAALEAKAQQRQAELMQDVLAARLEACTFAPRTGVARRQQLLDRILKQQPETDPLYCEF